MCERHLIKSEQLVSAADVITNSPIDSCLPLSNATYYWTEHWSCPVCFGFWYTAWCPWARFSKNLRKNPKFSI